MLFGFMGIGLVLGDWGVETSACLLPRALELHSSCLALHIGTVSAGRPQLVAAHRLKRLRAAALPLRARRTSRSRGS